MMDIAQTSLKRDGGKSNGVVAKAAAVPLKRGLAPGSISHTLFFNDLYCGQERAIGFHGLSNPAYLDYSRRLSFGELSASS